MKTITGTLDAYLLGDIYGMEALNNPDSNRALCCCSFFNYKPSGRAYVKVGTATITLTLIDEKEMIADAIESMRRERDNVRAEAEMKCRQIEEKIANLLAITYQPEAE